MLDLSRNRRVGGVVLGVILGVAGTVLYQAHPQGVKADGPVSTGRDSSGTIALTTQTPDSGQFLYIIDTQNQSFAVYRVDPRDAKGAVKLEAARQYRWDLKLAEFNNQAPEVATIESMVGAPRR